MYIKIKEPYERTIHIMKVHHETEDCYVCELKMDNSYLCADKEWLLAKSDTIEELCDEFVLINNVAFTVPQIITCTNFQNTKAYREDYGKYETIYGAIWTDKGLIYVAKMDDEGKLELI